MHLIGVVVFLSTYCYLMRYLGRNKNENTWEFHFRCDNCLIVSHIADSYEDERHARIGEYKIKKYQKPNHRSQLTLLPRAAEAGVRLIVRKDTMYSDFKTISTYYDTLYVNDREYAPEAAKVKELLTKHGVSSQADLLILACGTGGHIPYFKDDYHVSGLDLSEDMLALARKKFPDLGFYLGNLINFELETDFDAMICMYGSIGFVKTVDNLRASLKRIAGHLRPDGLVLLTPWSTVEDFQELIVVDSADKPDLKIARMEHVRLKEPKIVEVTFHHLLGENNEVAYHKQSMEIGLFSRQEYLSSMTDAGLKVVEEYTGANVRGGAYIGKRIVS